MMMTTSRTTIRLSGFGAATPLYTTAADLFEAWLAGQYAPGVPAIHEDVNLWRALTRQAMRQAVLPLAQRHDCGLILATTKGHWAPVEAWLNAGSQQDTGSPPPVLSDAARLLGDEFGLGGPRMVVSTACSSGLTALIEAALLVRTGTIKRMVVCAADIAGGFIHDGFNALRAITKSRCRPFDRRRDGLALGSAAAACLVTAADDPVGREHFPSVCLEGWGIATDATHLTAPDRDAAGLVRAIRQALRHIPDRTDCIDAVLLHGTGTAYNDAMEALAMRTVFTYQPYLTAAKGFLGHTLGASGLVETALAAWMLHRQVIPAITGLEDPQWPELNFVHAAARPAPMRRIMKTASGFGGLNAALILRVEQPAEAQ
jgi:3-oxoacyl-(acyl-carrier-protein) synthase